MTRLTLLLALAFLAIHIESLPANINHVLSDSTTIQGGINGAMVGDMVHEVSWIYYYSDSDFLGRGRLK
jgi:hypothetical protein